jgi:NADPH:quinone reductase
MPHYPIPEQMTAVVLQSYDGAAALRVEQRPVPKPGPNEVLIKVAATPINPSDLLFLLGGYGFQKAAPVVPGLEGSGTVVAVGSGLRGRYLAGRRVACISQGGGLWAEYVVTSNNYVLPLAGDVTLEQGAMSVVNPLTAVALLEITKEGGHKSVVNTAAASTLGQMIDRLARQEGVGVINVVRREAQVELLKQQGAALVLNSRSDDFQQQFRDVCHQHRTRLAFDAIAGDMTSQLLEAMPRHSRVIVYGGLSRQAAQAPADQLIFQGKVVDGFWLSSWMRQKNFLQSLLLWRRVQKLLATTLKSDIRARYPLAEAQQAVLDYQKQMTGGKILIVPGQVA